MTPTDRDLSAHCGRTCVARIANADRGGQPVALTPREFDLLMALQRSRGTVVSRLELLQEVWGHSSAVLTRTVDTHVAELRRKLEADPAAPEHIRTVRKAGYRLARLERS